jgi:hypothetical protein
MQGLTGVLKLNSTRDERDGSEGRGGAAETEVGDSVVVASALHTARVGYGI